MNMVDLPSFPDKPRRSKRLGASKTPPVLYSAYGVKPLHRAEYEAKKDGEFAYVWYHYMSQLLEEGALTAQPFEIMPDGLESVGKGVEVLFKNEVSVQKLAHGIVATSGAPGSKE